MKKIIIVFSKALKLMKSPASEWKNIAAEEGGIRDLFVNFLLPFTLITMLACFIGYGIVGSKQSMFGLVASEKLGIRYALYYAFLLIGSIFISTSILSILAPFFEATSNFSRNFRLIVYSFSPSMTATLLLIIPLFAPLVLLAGIYNLIILLSGLTRMTFVPVNKKWGYFAAIVGTLVFVFFAVAKILTQIIIN